MTHSGIPMTRILLIALALLVLAACGAPHTYNATELDPPRVVEDWTLVDQHGQPFRLADQRGDVVVLYFGYTNCPDFCPATMGDWVQIRRQLGAEADRVRFVLITVDPARDSEDVLARYLAGFDESFIGARPTAEQLESLSREYGVGVDSNAQAGHQHGDAPDPAFHGTYSYVIDRQGRLRLLFRADAEVDAMVADLRALLREG
jgi:protein SCO1